MIGGLLAFLLVGAIPLLPLCVRPLTKHRSAGVRRVAKALAMTLLWFGFNVSLMTIWGAVRFVPEWWALLIGVPFLEIAAVWLSYLVVFAGDDRT
jgi:hypothetical protein